MRRGGGIYNNLCWARVSNSTISGNSASVDGNSDIRAAAMVTAAASTAMRVAFGAHNTMVATTEHHLGGNCSTAHEERPYQRRLQPHSDNTCGFIRRTNNFSLSGVDPMLGPLADNGGPTKTHALLEGSPAIDRGNSFGAEHRPARLAPTERLRGHTGRQGDGSDIGSFELQAPPTPPKVTSTDPGNGREVGPAVNVKATFSENMRSARVMNDLQALQEGLNHPDSRHSQLQRRHRHG